MVRRLAAVAALAVAACSSEPRPESWTRRIGTPFDDGARAVATDAVGSVYLAGATYGWLDGEAHVDDLPDEPHAFVVKYDAAGALRWIRQLEAPWVSEALAVATGGDGTVLVAGWGRFDGTTAGCSDAFVAQYDGGGARQWMRVFGTPYCDRFVSLATSASGDVVLAGSTEGTFSGEQPPGGGDGFVTKYDRDGGEQWTRALGGGWGASVATDAAGNVLVAGYTAFGLDGNASAGDLDAFVVKYDAAGTRLWTRQLGTPLEDDGWSVATDATGNVFVGGATLGGLDGNPSTGGWEPFVAKYDARGERLWTRQLGTAEYDVGRAVATDADGNVFLAGVMHGIRDPFPDVHVSNGDLDAFVAKYDAAGTLLWLGLVGGAGVEEGTAVATDRRGNVFVAGSTSEVLDGTLPLGLDDAFVASFDAAGHAR